MKESEKLIDYWCDQLAKRTVEIRFIDMDEMKAAIKTHFMSAIHDCLTIQIDEIEEKLRDAQKRASTIVGSHEHIKAEIISIKQSLKRRNKFRAEIENETKKSELLTWMRDHQMEILLKFYDFYKVKYPNH